MIEWIRFIAGSIFILTGLFMTVLAVSGVYRFNYVMNRMHLAAMGDTTGLFCTLIGLMIYAGWSVMTAKFALIIAFFWLASPVSGHMVAEIEIATNENAGKEFEVTKP